MWNVHKHAVPSGVRINVLSGNSSLPFRELFNLLRNDSDFADWFGKTIADCDFDAFFLEFPPLTTSTFENDAEFVIIESRSLSNVRADPVPFESQFLQQPGTDVITFPNLGGDALLIVPAQLGEIEIYPHLATFLRNAPTQQIRTLWAVAADAVDDNLSAAPRWFSTAGLGVSWLHLRLDTYPKYYNYSPYKNVV